jgi:hypothetical protein
VHCQIPKQTLGTQTVLIWLNASQIKTVYHFLHDALHCAKHTSLL